MKEDKPNGKDWWDFQPRTITEVYPHGDENKLGRGTWMLICNRCYGEAVERYGPGTKPRKVNFKDITVNITVNLVGN